jgi:hypothetical protein
MVIYVDVLMVVSKWQIVRHRKVYFKLSIKIEIYKYFVLDPCLTMPCGPQGRCLPLNAAPKGYMCMCQVDSVSYTTIDTCPSIKIYLFKNKNFNFLCFFS